jgi:hypothetical protein
MKKARLREEPMVKILREADRRPRNKSRSSAA